MEQELLDIIKRLEGKNNLERRKITEEILEDFGLPYFKQKSEGIVNFIIDFAPKKPSPILVSGHYDAAEYANSPGAADNATSVAVIVGLADKMFMEAPFKRNVRFALFDQEEAGLFGSKAYIESSNHIEPYVFNLEWVGDQKNVLVWPAVESQLTGPYAFFQDAVLTHDGSFSLLPYQVIPTDADNFREEGKKAFTISTLKDYDFKNLQDFMSFVKIKQGNYQEALERFMPVTEFSKRYHSENDTSEHLNNETLCFVRDVLYTTFKNYFELKDKPAKKRKSFLKWQKHC